MKTINEYTKPYKGLIGKTTKLGKHEKIQAKPTELNIPKNLNDLDRLDIASSLISDILSNINVDMFDEIEYPKKDKELAKVFALLLLKIQDNWHFYLGNDFWKNFEKNYDNYNYDDIDEDEIKNILSSLK